VAAQALSIDPASLYCAFEQVADGRKQKSKRYPLPLLLTLLLLGKLAGETTINGIVDSRQRATRMATGSLELAAAAFPPIPPLVRPWPTVMRSKS
jgi:hypothetical protein